MKKTIAIFLLLAVSFGCTKETDTDPFELPAITTTIATSTYNTTTLTGGTITDDGGAAITARGVCWATDHNPVVSNDHTSDGTGTGSFSSAVTGLLPSTIYYIRAYATNSVGTSYGNEITITTLDHDVYIGGALLNAANFDVATIWKNGVASALTDGTHEAYINCITVDNADVYAGGIEHNGTYWVAKVWKNGIPTTLTNGTSDANVYSIVVAGSDVYLGGEEGQVAKIWKNGISTSLTGGTHISSVYVVGSDVYGCGDYYNYPISYAQFWKNGILTPLTDQTTVSNANAVFVSGSDVYVAGRENLVAKIWKNGISIPVSDGTEFNMVTNLYVNGTNVYAAGYGVPTAGGNSIIRYWENGTMSSLTDISSSAKPLSIFPFGSDLFLCGTDADEIKIWKNGIPRVITSIGTNTIKAIYLH